MITSHEFYSLIEKSLRKISDDLFTLMKDEILIKSIPKQKSEVNIYKPFSEIKSISKSLQLFLFTLKAL